MGELGLKSGGPIRIDEDEVEFRKRFLELSKSDEELLRKIGEVLDEHADEIIDLFYEHLLSFPETKAFLKDEETVRKVKGFQKAYFKRLTKGGYDLEYFRSRLKIDEAHDRVKLPLKLYVGAYNKYHQIVIPKICEGLGYKDCSATLPVAAFSRMIFLDMSLAIDAYIASRENALRESEEHYRTLVTASLECICNIDLEGNFVYMNPAGLMMHEKREKEVVGMHCTKLVKPAYSDLIKKTLEKAKGGETIRFQYEIDQPRGSRWLESILTPIRDDSGKVVSLLRISDDISERKQTEEERKKRLEELEKFHNLAVGRELRMTELKAQIKKLEDRVKELESKGV